MELWSLVFSRNWKDWVTPTHLQVFPPASPVQAETLTNLEPFVSVNSAEMPLVTANGRFYTAAADML